MSFLTYAGELRDLKIHIFLFIKNNTVNVEDAG